MSNIWNNRLPRLIAPGYYSRKYGTWIQFFVQMSISQCGRKNHRQKINLRERNRGLKPGTNIYGQPHSLLWAAQFLLFAITSPSLLLLLLLCPLWMLVSANESWASATSPHTRHPATVYQLHEGWRESNYLALPFAVSISPVQDNQSSLLLLDEDCTWTIKPCVGLQNEPRSEVWKT